MVNLVDKERINLRRRHVSKGKGKGKIHTKTDHEIQYRE